jgi:hypothetical protein
VAALRALESITLDRDTVREKERLALRYAELVYFGQWFTPLREGLDAFFESVMENVTGSVTLKLYKGSVTTCGRRSAHSLSTRARVLRYGGLHAPRRGLHPPLRPSQPRLAAPPHPGRAGKPGRRGVGDERAATSGSRFQDKMPPVLARFKTPR